MSKSLSSILTASAAGLDPALNDLFSKSVGPAKVTKPGSQPTRRTARAAHKSSEEDDESQDDDESDAASGSSSEEDDESEDESMEDAPSPRRRAAERVGQAVIEGTDKTHSDRKRKRKDPTDDLEGNHLRKLMGQDEEEERSNKRTKGAETSKDAAPEAGDEEESDDGEADLVHESLVQGDQTDPDKVDRTVFLANVSTSVISSKEAKRTLEKHLESVLDKSTTPPEKLESIRFRSLAFSALSLPKRAAFITKSLMDTTTKSCNAYVVYSTAAAARKAASTLNATQVLDRHLRVDSVAHPSPTDHRRCVFVGNLGFVDDETVVSTDAEGNTTTKKRYKVPSDIEEGLWRTFTQKAGKVESVRVVRDPHTRVGKGFAYVQFYDANDVEAALLLDGKKFTPMLPRALRVSRAKNPRSTNMALQKRGIHSASTGSSTFNARNGPKIDGKSTSRRDMRRLGVAGAARQTHIKKALGDKEIKTPERIVYEGTRASAGDNKHLKQKQRKKGAAAKRLKGKRAERAKDWKKRAPKSKE
ncbi:related to nuM1, hnRNP protein [Cephalotrichum gorgonifer]|uniref:Nucleolar protein 12 n=1 Tax=Cephalotrichum gorgonifer TaxID=2041049 RepID=A0AAE8STT2_9PEZI|nr:related to nuM1, hnRNP protein [Cephalotrichum gorgonifer]